jgi:hypothetical protein
MPFGGLGFHTNCGINKRYLLVKSLWSTFFLLGKSDIKNVKIWKLRDFGGFQHNGCVGVSG